MEGSAAKKQLLKDLEASEEKTVLKALDKLAQTGDGDMVLPLLVLYRDTNSELAKAKAAEMLTSLKVSVAEDVLIEALEGDDFIALRADILSFIWNSGFQPNDAVDTITKVALSGDFMTGVEGLTVLESLGGPLDEESLYQALIEVRKFLEAHKEHGHDLYELALRIFEVLAGHEKD
jgi:hypothetical protein